MGFIKEMTIYTQGRRKEYKICYDERALNRIAIRTAGSHSPFDIISIDVKDHTIRLIQSKRKLSEKMDYIDPKLKEKLEKENKNIYEGDYKIIFEVR